MYTRVYIIPVASNLVDVHIYILNYMYKYTHAQNQSESKVNYAAPPQNCYLCWHPLEEFEVCLLATTTATTGAARSPPMPTCSSATADTLATVAMEGEHGTAVYYYNAVSHQNIYRSIIRKVHGQIEC